MSFIVAFNRSRSFRSSSSSTVSTLRAPVTTLEPPGRRLSGRKLGGSGFFSPPAAPVNSEKLRQSKDMDRRWVLTGLSGGGPSLGGDWNKDDVGVDAPGFVDARPAIDIDSGRGLCIGAPGDLGAESNFLNGFGVTGVCGGSL